MKLTLNLKTWWQKVRGPSAEVPQGNPALILAVAEAQCIEPLRPKWQSVKQAGSKRLVDRLPEPTKRGAIAQLQAKTPYDAIARDLALRGFYISPAALSSYAREVLGLRRQMPYESEENE